MDIMKLIRARHSVRRYLEKPIEQDKRNVIDTLVTLYKQESGLNLQVRYDEPQAFQSFLAHYGSFRNVVNYIALVGKKEEEVQAGYYGEALVLKLQELGLNSCWVAISYSKRKIDVEVSKNESILSVISFGYGETQGVVRKSKKPEEVSIVIGEKPSWFDLGVEASLLAPTAVNQQKFMITCENGQVSIRKNGIGYFQYVDLGIIKYHFEAATGQKVDIVL